MLRALATAWLVVLGLAINPLPAQRGRGESPAPTSPEAQRCAALSGVALPDLPDAPARVLSARLMDVPSAGLTDGR